MSAYFQVSICVPIRHQLMHHLSTCPSVRIFQCMCCPSVWQRDNAEPCEAACLSVVAPCSWPTLGEVN